MLVKAVLNNFVVDRCKKRLRIKMEMTTEATKAPKRQKRKKRPNSLEEAIRTANLVLTNAAYAFCLFDEDLTIQYWSDDLEKITGTQASVAIGTKIDSLFPFWVDDTRRLKDCITGIPSVSTNIHYVIPALKKEYRLELNYIPFTMGEDCPARGLILFKDMTKEFEMNRKLIDSEARFKNMVDAAPVLLWLTSEDGSCNYVNQSWLDFTGRKLEQELGMGWSDGIHPEDRDRCIHEIFNEIKAHRAFEVEYRLRNRCGNYRWVMARGIPHYNHEERFSGFAGSCIDINEHKVLVDDLQGAKTAADAASITKTQFLANVSHEIRTPLGIILGFADVLRNDNIAEEERMGLLDRILKNGNQLLHLVDDILDVSKVEANKFEIELLQFSLEDFIKEINELFELKCQEKGLEFKTVKAIDLPEFVKADPTRMRQILTNIIGNAIKFTPTGRIELQIRTYPIKDKLCLTFEVIDTGTGIDLSSSEKIFKPFSQVDSSTTRKFGGTGLGLHLSRKLARILGGDLELVKSELSIGSTFAFHVPVEVVQAKDNLTTHSVKLDEKESFKDLKGSHILIVDDAEENRMLIGRYLKPYETLLDYAQNGAEAVEMTHKENFDLILMDIQMPVLDGYGAIKKIRSYDTSTPVVALTAHALKTEREHCLQAGFNEHVTKPLNKQKLMSLISQLVSQRKSNLMSKT